MKKYHVATGDGKGYYGVNYESYREATELLKISQRHDPKAHIIEEEYYFTNADRIRAMSDEMLAEFLILSPEMEFDVCLLCQFGNPTQRDDRGQCLSGYGACDAESRAEAFKKWLKQPAEVE